MRNFVSQLAAPVFFRGALFFLLLLGFAFLDGREKKRGKLKFGLENSSISKIEEEAQRLYDLGEYKRAADTYQYILLKYSDQFDRYEKELAWTTYEIGFCYLILKKYDTALEYFNKVLENYTTVATRILSAQRIEDIEKIKKRTKKRKKKQ